jgi:ubiquinone/menaquinone biosynthesis C-methylase UbiE
MSDSTKKTAMEIWDSIAESFDTTRKKPWQQCLDFITGLPQESVVGDFGCGNGRHLLPAAAHCTQVVGFDISRNLLAITRKKINENHIANAVCVQGDLVRTPFRENVFDAILYIASLHNIQGRDARRKSLQEVQRILKPEGTALISVWLRWQDSYRAYFLKQWFHRRKNTEFGDITIYWRQQGLNEPRFYHLYSVRELLSDIRSSGFNITGTESVTFHSKKSPDNVFIEVIKKG